MKKSFLIFFAVIAAATALSLPVNLKVEQAKIDLVGRKHTGYDAVPDLAYESESMADAVPEIAYESEGMADTIPEAAHPYETDGMSEDAPHPRKQFRNIFAKIASRRQKQEENEYESKDMADGVPEIAYESKSMADTIPELAYESEGMADAAPELAYESEGMADAAPELAYESEGMADAAPEAAHPYETDGMSEDAPHPRKQFRNIFARIASLRQKEQKNEYESKDMADGVPEIAYESESMADAISELHDASEAMADTISELAFESESMADTVPELAANMNNANEHQVLTDEEEQLVLLKAVIELLESAYQARVEHHQR